MRYIIKRCFKYLNFGKSLLFPLGKKSFLIGTPLHGNMGDSAIEIAEKNFIKQFQTSKRIIKEISFKEYGEYWKILRVFIPKSAPIFLQGGGNMGDVWMEEEWQRRDILERFRENLICIFPQTIFYTDTDNGRLEQERSIQYYNRANVTVVAREKISYEIMKKIYPDANVLLTPDIVLSGDLKMFGVNQFERKGAMFCFRHDKEKDVDEKIVEFLKAYVKKRNIVIRTTDMCITEQVTKANRLIHVRHKMEEFVKSEFVVTDRLHAMIFSVLTNTPCIVFQNNNYKIYGTYEWIKDVPSIFLVDSIDDAIKCISKIKEMKYIATGNTTILEKYEPLINYLQHNNPSS